MFDIILPKVTGYRICMETHPTEMCYHNITLDASYFKKRVVIINSRLLKNGKNHIFYQRLLEESNLEIKDLADFVINGTPEGFFEFITDRKLNTLNEIERELLLALTISIFANNESNQRIIRALEIVLILFHKEFILTDMTSRFVRPLHSSIFDIEILFQRAMHNAGLIFFASEILFVNLSSDSFSSYLSSINMRKLFNLGNHIEKIHSELNVIYFSRYNTRHDNNIELPFMTTGNCEEFPIFSRRDYSKNLVEQCRYKKAVEKMDRGILAKISIKQ